MDTPLLAAAVGELAGPELELAAERNTLLAAVHHPPESLETEFEGRSRSQRNSGRTGAVAESAVVAASAAAAGIVADSAVGVAGQER